MEQSDQGDLLQMGIGFFGVQGGLEHGAGQLDAHVRQLEMSAGPFEQKHLEKCY